jgi:hypothetical protein
VLGLLLAPSIAGFYLALSAIGFFLARHPLTLVVMNRRRSSPRTALARRFATLYLIIGGASFIAALAFAQHPFVLPLVMAGPFAILQIAHDWTGRRRRLLSELAGVIAIASLATAVTMAAGWPARAGFALWALMIARSIPAVLYVRACLRRQRLPDASPRPMMVAHLSSIGVAVALAGAGVISGWVLLPMVMLLVRAIIGFARARTVRARQLGFSEIAFGAMTVIVVAASKYF